MAGTQQRLYYIDWIRVFAFLILIFFHSAMPFVRFGWEIKSTDRSISLDRLIIWLHQWRLPLLFFISGVGVSFSLKKRSVIKFFSERVVRLFIPLLFAMFFTIPLQVYFERLQKGQITLSYWQFYPSVWELVPYPDGTLTWSHMWFVVYLFVFTILLLPVFALFKTSVVQRLVQRINPAFRHPIVLLLLSAPFIYYFYSLFIKWPAQGSLLDDWFVFISSITFYFFGFLLSGLPSFWESCEKFRRYFLMLVLGLVAVLFWKYYWPVSLPKQQNGNLTLYSVLNGLHIWVIILTIIGYARRYLNVSSRWLRYLSPAVYPFYILHQTVIVATGYYIVDWPIPIFLRLALIIVSCFTIIIALYHLIIRRFILTRILYGLKWKPSSLQLKSDNAVPTIEI